MLTNFYAHLGHFYLHGLTLIMAWIGNHMPSKVCDEIAYPFPNCTVEVWEWISNFPTLYDGRNYLSMLWLELINLIHVSRRGPGSMIWKHWRTHSKTCRIHRHYNDVIMGTMVSQITSLTIVYSSVYSGADQRKHQRSASLAFLRGIHRWPVNSPHKWPVMRKMLPFDYVIMHISISPVQTHYPISFPCVWRLHLMILESDMQNDAQCNVVVFSQGLNTDLWVKYIERPSPVEAWRNNNFIITSRLSGCIS